MKFNIQTQLELRRFKNVKRYLNKLPVPLQRLAIVEVLQTHNVVMWDKQIPEEVKCEILEGIEDICGRFEFIVNEVQTLIDRELEHRDSQPGLAYEEYREAVTSYKTIYDSVIEQYHKGQLSLLELSEVYIAFGELERNLNVMRGIHGIEEDFSI